MLIVSPEAAEFTAAWIVEYWDGTLRVAAMPAGTSTNASRALIIVFMNLVAECFRGSEISSAALNARRDIGGGVERVTIRWRENVGVLARVAGDPRAGIERVTGGPDQAVVIRVERTLDVIVVIVL